MEPTQLHWREWGAGDRIALLIHGIMTDGSSWGRIAPSLVERGYRVLAPDLRGHGQSPRSDDYAWPVFANDIAAHLGDAPIDIAIGHSLGGGVLGALSDRLSISRFIYVDPAWDLPVQGRPDDPEMFAQMASGTDAEVMALFAAWPEEERKIQLEAVRRWDPETARGLLRSGKVYAIPRFAGRPALVVTAENSILVPAEQQRKLVEQGFVVRGAGTPDHAPHRLDPQGFVSLVADWIE